MVLSVMRKERRDDARELDQVYASLNVLLLDLLETSISGGTAQNLRSLSSELAKKSENL